jgi:hypothetical protein
MVSLVGLRGNIFFLPMMLLAMRLRDEELSKLALGIALLDIASLGVALAEYVFGIESFYPANEVTQLIYDMNDVVAGSNVYRIPSTFSQAHGYAGTMLGTIPFLYGGWVMPKTRARDRLMLFAGLVAALFGILLAASRSAFILTALAATFITFSSSTNKNLRKVWIVLLACIAAVTVNDVRLQRFTTLKNTDYVEGRIAGSVNRTFLEILLEYPMGNGLGGGGTSIPYFWQGRVRQPVGLESEYCRILIEQTVVGLMLWISFILWLASSSKASVPTRWREGRRLAWFISLAGFFTAMIGTGMFTAVPQTLLFFLSVGWFSTLPASGIRDVLSRSRATYRVPKLAVRGEHA